MKDLNFDDYSSSDLIKSLIAESAKSLGEIKCAQGDLEKVNSRLRFLLAVLHKLQERFEDEKKI